MKTITTILYEICEHAIEVEQTHNAPNPAPRANIHIRTVPDSRPPTDLTTWDLLRPDPLDGLTIGKGNAPSHLIDRLGMCVRMIAEERAQAGLDAPEPAYGTFAATTGYLASTASWWTAEHGLNVDVDHEVRQVHKTLRQQARVRPEYRPRCRDCEWELSPMDGGSWYRCSGCNRDYTIDADLKALGQIQSAPLSEISTIVNVPVKTLHRWVKAGLLTPDDRRRGNARIYHIEAVRRVAERMRQAG